MGHCKQKEHIALSALSLLSKIGPSLESEQELSAVEVKHAIPRPWAKVQTMCGPERQLMVWVMGGSSPYCHICLESDCLPVCVSLCVCERAPMVFCTMYT